MSERANGNASILYCHCRYTKVLPAEVKGAVLERLSASGKPFEAVADLCELSARRDDSLGRLCANGPMVIAACYPRVVLELLRQGGATRGGEDVTVLNMREQDADEVCGALEV